MRQEGRHTKKRNSWINSKTLVPPTAVGRKVSQDRWDAIFNQDKNISQESVDGRHKEER